MLSLTSSFVADVELGQFKKVWYFQLFIFKQKSPTYVRGAKADANEYGARESAEFGRVSKPFDTWVAFSQISPDGPWVTRGLCFRGAHNHSRGLSPQRRPPPPLHMRRDCASAAAAAAPGMTFPACLCLAPRAREIYGSLSSKEFSCSNDEPRCLISTKFSANQLVILFHNTKLIKRRGARISEGVNKRLASSEKLLRKRVTDALRWERGCKLQIYTF